MNFGQASEQVRAALSPILREIAAGRRCPILSDQSQSSMMAQLFLFVSRSASASMLGGAAAQRRKLSAIRLSYFGN
jgi:hypothetical protein